MNQSTTKTYDERFGKPLTETDPNDCFTRYDYEALGRIKTVENCGNSESAFAWEEIFYDGLGRKIRTEKEGPDGKIIAGETKYNARGLVDKTSLPYFADTSGNPLETARWTYFEYDPLGRVTKVTNPDNTTQQKFYARGRTTMVDANGHQKVEEKDVYGRLVKVEEYSGAYPSASLYATTMYNYDVLGNLVNVTDAQSNITTINYNSLSQKTDMTDPDMGTWYYTYDLNGNLETQTDAKSQVITFEYDPLNRVDWKRYPDGTLVDYSYDNSGIRYEPCPAGSYNLQGRLSRVVDSSGATEFCYDALGRAVKMIQTVDGIKYNTETVYDELGRTDRIKYPDSELVSYRYNGGFLEAVAIGAETHVRYTGYNAFGQPGTMNNDKNGVNTIYGYWAENNRLKTIKTTGSANLQDLYYQYDNVGNITNITDNLNTSRSQTFIYDHLDRFTNAYSGVYGTISYQYNEIGNMTYNSQVGSYTYWKQYYGTKPHAVYQAGANTYGYDTNGNMTSGAGRTITYNYDNMPVNINGNSFVYDYGGQRVKKNSTIYIGKLYECTGSTCNKYIFAGKNRIALKTSSNIYYYHTDHLESSSVMTDASGIMKEEIYYYPFGKTRSNTGTLNVKHKFTGQEEDDETGVGLYYYGARYYEPTIGKFISPDPMEPFDTRADKTSVEFQNLQGRIKNLNVTEDMNVQNLGKMNRLRLIDQFIASNPDYTKDGKTGEDVQKLQELKEAVLLNPQRLNRYAYVGNNPVNRKDPRGLTWLVFDPNSDILYVHPGTTETQGPPQAFTAGNYTDSRSRGPIPAGIYPVGDPLSNTGDRANRITSQGSYFIPIYDIPGRSEIGIHGGRTGWDYPTMGCIRMNNEDLTELVNIHRGDPIATINVTPLK